MIQDFNGISPRIDPSAFVAPGVVVIGDVSLGPWANVWYGVILRGDVNCIRVGEKSNIQDQCVVHVTHDGPGVSIGGEVVVGHRAVLHDCTVQDRALIGIGAIVLDRAVVGAGAVIAAGSVVPPGAVIPPGVLAMGAPAKPRRELSAGEMKANLANCHHYLELVKYHQDPSSTGWRA